MGAKKRGFLGLGFQFNEMRGIEKWVFEKDYILVAIFGSGERKRQKR